MKSEPDIGAQLTSPPGGEVGAQRRVRGKASNSTSRARALRRNEAEDISREWATAGAEVLMHAVVETAEIVE